MASTVLKGVRSVLAKMHNTIIIPLSFIFDFDFVTSNGSLNKVPFLAAVNATNLVPSLLQSAPKGQSIEAIVAEVLFVTGKMWYYKFLINPQNFTFNPTKLQVEEETSDIPILNTYRNKIIPMTFTGISGCTIPRTFLELTGEDGNLVTDTLAKNPKLSAAWMKFRQLEKFYNEVNEDIVIMFDMDIYVGKFSSLQYSMDANNPWQINYTLNMKIYPDLTLHMLNVYDYTTFFNAMNERYGRFLANDFEGKYKSESLF